MEIKDIELAWMAGFFDGEGSIGLKVEIRNFNGIKFGRRICIVNTRRDILEIFKKYFGGSVLERKHFQNYTGSENWKPIYSWQVHSRLAVDFISRIYPYIRLKKKQAELFLDYDKHFRNYSLYNRRRDKKGRFPPIDNKIIKTRLKIVEKMKLLNLRGNKCHSISL